MNNLMRILLVAVQFIGVLSVSAVAQDKPPVAQPAPVTEEPAGFPKYQEMVLPEAEALLRSRPFDWIVLKNQDVVVVEPLSLRPDPISKVPIKYEMAQRTYNRLLKNKPYRDAEITSLRQFQKDPERVKEIDDLEAASKLRIEAAQQRVEMLKPATFKLRVTLQDTSVDSEFLLEMRYVELFVHYEDLVLRRAEQLIQSGNVSLAYDLLLLVARRHRENNEVIRADLEADEAELMAAMKQLEDEKSVLRQSRDELNAPRNKNSPAARQRANSIEKTITGIIAEVKDLEEDLRSVRFKLRFARPKDFPNPEPPRKDDVLLLSWPKFDEIYQRFVLKDSDLHLDQGDTEGAWRLLVELWKPGLDIPGLSARLGGVADRLIAPRVEQQDFRQARFYLRELLSREPASPIGIGWRDKLVDMTSNAIAQARGLSDRGNSADAAREIDRAARIWPEQPGLKELHRDLTDRYQILRVGVLHLAGDPSPDRLPTEADERVRMLSEARMFEPINISDQGVRYGSVYLDSWEPTDLGRQVHFQLKLRRADWEARPLITSADIHRELMGRLQQSLPTYDERLAGFIEGVSVQSPSEFTVRFRQLPLRLEALWQMTVASTEASRDLNEDSRDTNNPMFGRERFHREPGENGQLRLTRVRQQQQVVRLRRVDEVVEIRYESWERALQALVRGDVVAIPLVDLADLKGLQDDGRFLVVPYVLPRSHFLMFNPQSSPLRDGQLRRALMHGIPREKLLNGVILKEARSSNARLVTCPFASTSYAYNRALSQPYYEPSLAAALALTAKKQLGGQIPPLTMICPDDPHLREAALAMVEQWRRIGVEVRLSDVAASNSEWDISYRTAKPIEPLMDAWPLLTMSADARIAALQGVPESTRRMLLELERSVDWTAATKLLHRLLSELLTDARYIPLWEVDEFLVTRRHVTGLPARLLHSYQDIERWTVQSWYPQDVQ